MATHKLALVGRSKETTQIKLALESDRHVLIEGPVGVGKTALALDICRKLRRPVIRVDGDGRYTEQKLVGWFDPPLVLKKGFVAQSFHRGPLVEAMKSGATLFLNELNRLPEGVQNVLLPAIDERSIILPHLGEVRAKLGFSVIATQNPKEFVATSLLSEALLDRFEWIRLDYLSLDEESIALQQRGVSKELAQMIAVLMDRTRHHDSVSRGASLRAGLSLAALLEGRGTIGEAEFVEASVMAFTTRIETRDGQHPSEFVRMLAKEVFLGGNPSLPEKKSP